MIVAKQKWKEMSRNGIWLIRVYSSAIVVKDEFQKRAMLKISENAPYRVQ